MTHDRLDDFGVYKLASQLFDDFWQDPETVMKDERGRELVKQQTRSLDSVCTNIEEGFGRGFNKENPQHLKIARGEALESKGRYWRMRFLLSLETVNKHRAVLDQFIGGLTATIVTLESKQRT